MTLFFQYTLEGDAKCVSAPGSLVRSGAKVVRFGEYFRREGPEIVLLFAMAWIAAGWLAVGAIPTRFWEPNGTKEFVDIVEHLDIQ